MYLLLVAVCLVSVSAVPVKRCDYDCVMGLVEHAYHHVDLGQPIGGASSTYVGKRDISAMLQSLSSSIANAGTALQQTFGSLPQHGSDALSSVIQTALHPVAGLLNGVMDGLQHANMVEVEKRGASEFFSNIGHQLSTTFTNLGHAFQNTFEELAHTAALQGTELLSQALQGGAMVVANGASTLAKNLQHTHTDAQKRSAHQLFSNIGQQLSTTFTNLGHVFQETFEGLAQGSDLLSQALQGGAQVLANGANNIAANLQPSQTFEHKRDAADFLAELQQQLQHLGDLLKPYVNHEANNLFQNLDTSS
ncbi:uncharacterized protein LOC132553820 [Ylistrum balloti]|uniref:uncharacterized protein LOC132553820 n=1 Tax=Ylistrum balloti TaxID=509963 RepID=UPI002905B9E8|nr:uncharacterized protein LOC132553820 [Ylistrum balloti]